jgi:hypothetical protein
METLKISIDFGLVVLIWMTQLIVYPGFKYYPQETLYHWHRKYTGLITFIVAPLMFAQLGLHLLALIGEITAFNLVAFFLIVGCWILTFAWAVPLHSRIDQGLNVSIEIQKLIHMNWYRTFGWSSVFLVSYCQYLF